MSAVVLGAALVSAIVAAVAVWREHRDAAELASLQVLQLVDEGLDGIESELSALENEPGFAAASEPCPPTLAAALARASLTSHQVRYFMVTAHTGASACRPDGRSVASASSSSGDGAQRALQLSTTGGMAARLVATRVARDGRVLSAVLDSQTFANFASTYPSLSASLSAAHAVRLALVSPQGRRLANLGPSPDAAVVPALRAMARSQRHAAVVQVDIGRDAMMAAAWKKLLMIWAAVALALGASIVLVWRHAVLRSRLHHRIERGLRKRQFEPFVQPIVDLATGRCAGAEVLMRWLHPQRGTLAPGEFIEEAERSGLIVGMSELVMSRAAHRLAPIAAAHPDMYFSINLTPAQLRLPGFAQQLDALFHAETVPREQVLLELTEREFVDSDGARALASLRAAGWRIAIDDFGTGQSSLAMLEKLPIDRIKIDRAFVSTIGEQTARRPVLDAIIALADQLEVRLIAEGVETQAQWDYLAQRGVHCAQGFLIARPMSVDAFAQWLMAQQPAQQPAQPAAPASHASLASVDSPVLDKRAQQLWHRMRTSGGLDVRDRIHRLRSYPSCFVGREAVDWLARHQNISRAEAVRLGQRLSALGLVRHVADEHDFKDAELFYRLSPSEAGEASAAASPAAADLREAIRGTRGVRQTDHARGFLRHRACTTGREIVDWVSHTYAIARPTAVQWAAQLMRHGTLRHVHDDQPFRDDAALYRLT